MSREKQIEEMAKDINIADHEYCNGRCIGCEHKPKRIEDCACVDIAIATGLAAKGYRKAYEVANEIFAEIEEKVNTSLVIYFEEMNKEHIKDTPLYDRCSGSVFAFQNIKDFLDSLKKKYTGARDNV